MILRSFVLALCLCSLVSCRSSGTLPDYNVNQSNLALQGYDPVAYFPEGGGTPTKGTAVKQVATGEGVFQFASDENLTLFRANSERYIPRYGGWCAWAMVEGERVEIDPESFLIEDGQLYLFYDGLFADTRKLWLEKGGASLRPLADQEWSTIQSNPENDQ